MIWLSSFVALLWGQASDDKLIEQQLILTDDNDDIAAFQIKFLVMDVEAEDDKLYNNEELINKINHLIYRK